MRLLPVLAAVLLLSGCGDMLSIEPLAGSANSVAVPALAGNWASEECMLIVKPGKDRAYDALFIDEKGEATPLAVRLVRIGEDTIADIQSTRPGAFSIPAHAFLLVRLRGDSLELRFIDSKWIQAQAQNADAPGHVLVDGHPVLTAASDAVRAFIARYGLREEAWGDVIPFTRLKK